MANNPSKDSPKQPPKRIVSSSHLVSEKAAELSEVEYGLIVASHAFGMWVVKAMSAALAELELTADLGVLDILCLHSLNHRGRPKKLADICFKLNVIGLEHIDDIIDDLDQALNKSSKGSLKAVS